MSRSRGQQGAALILIIGVVAALAILASALVLLTVNAAGNTMRDRHRAQAFHVTEGLIDFTLAQFGVSWPAAAAPTLDLDAFKSRYLIDAAAGGFTIQEASVTVFNDVDTNGDGVISRADGVPYDADGNGFLFIEAQATVNGQKARIQVKARARTLELQVPAGIAVATNSNVYDPNNAQQNGTYAIGCDPAYGGYMGTGSTALGIWAGGTNVDGGSTYDPTKFGPDLNGDGVPDGIQTGVTGAANLVVTQPILQSIISAAKMQGRWYSDIASEQAAGAQPIPAKNDTAKWTGVVVIETTSLVDLENNDTINGDGVGTNPDPGVLVIIGPQSMYPGSGTGKSQGLKIAGNGTYYGMVYTDGSVNFVGTMAVIGMVVAEGDVNLNGARCVQYNANVVQNLNQSVLVNAQIVPNTWRQIQPL